jgi:hypothetical protein
MITGLSRKVVAGIAVAGATLLGHDAVVFGRVQPAQAPAGRIAPAPASGEKRATVVKAPDSPVSVDHATVFTTAGAPPVVLYSVTNLTTEALDQFTLIAFTFNAEGTLKAMQIAPGRRTLNAGETKYSSMVLDGSPLEATDAVVVGINQAQKVNSEAWWRAELQAAAEATQRKTTATR